jgi:phosphomannomutase
MEITQTEINEVVNGLLYMPENHGLSFPSPTEHLAFRELTYDPAAVDDESLNFKFLMAAIEVAKDAPVDFILGFSADLKRIIVAMKNPEGKFQAFTAHQQAAIFAEYFLNRPGQVSNGDILVVKSLLLSNQIDTIVKKNEGRIAYSHAGYDSLRKAMAAHEQQTVIAMDDRNTVIIDGDVTNNALQLLEMLSKIVLNLKSQEQSLLDKHIYIQCRYNLYGEKTFNIPAESKKMFDKYRTSPPQDLIHDELILITDYKKKVFSNLLTGRKGAIELEQMNLVQLDYSSGLRISVEYVEDQSKLILHLSNYTHCYDKSRFSESRKAVHDRLLKTVVALGKM